MKQINNIYGQKRLNNRGISLVEILISLAILGIILLPLMGNFIASMQMNKKSEHYHIQSNLASSLMEGLKASSTKEIIDQFNGPKKSFNIIHNDFDSKMRLELTGTNEYKEKVENIYDEQSTDYYAIHQVKAGGTAYDVFIKLDATPYQKEIINGSQGILNKYPMPEIINLDKKANGLLFSDGSSVYSSIQSDTDQAALDLFVQQGENNAYNSLYNSEEYIQYQIDYNNWLNAMKEADMGGGPTPTPMYDAPTLESLNLAKYTDQEEIKKYVTKNMKIEINDTYIDYKIEHICDWPTDTGWSKTRIINTVDQVEYSTTIENVYLFYRPSVFHEARSIGSGVSADRIHIRNNDTANNIKFFVANQNNTMPILVELSPVIIERPVDDSIKLFTNISNYQAYVGDSEDTTVNSELINTYELNRIFDITINICKAESEQSNRYKEVYYSLESTMER